MPCLHVHAFAFGAQALVIALADAIVVGLVGCSLVATLLVYQSVFFDAFKAKVWTSVCRHNALPYVAGLRPVPLAFR